MARPDSLQCTCSPGVGQGVDARTASSARSSSSVDRGQPVCSTTTTRSRMRGEPSGRGLELVRVGHQLEQQVPLGQGARAPRRRAPVVRRGPSGARPGSVRRPAARRSGARWPRPTESVGGRPPTIASGWPSVVAPGGPARGSRRPSGGRWPRPRSPASRRSSRPTRRR